jgi:DNA-directed RNA polymerase
VDEMNKHCRQQFVRLHSQPLLQSLHAYFQMHYDGLPYMSGAGTDKHHVCLLVCWRKKEKMDGGGADDNGVLQAILAIPPPPAQGSLDIDEVLRSRYFFN